MSVSREEALRAVAVVEEYLAQRQLAYYTRGSRGEEEYPEDPPHWNDAKEWAGDLLEASARDGHYGCPLCRS